MCFKCTVKVSDQILKPNLNGVILMTSGPVDNWRNDKPQINLIRLQTLQNKCAPFVYLVPKYANVTPLLNDLHRFRIEEPIKFKFFLYVYKSLNGLCPQYITDCLVVKRPHLGSDTTRSCHGLDLLIPIGWPDSLGIKPFQWLLLNYGTHFPFAIAVLPVSIVFKSSAKTYLFV